MLLAACQPASRRALLLDLALSDPALLEGTATPWAAAGYAVEYRRFYPHLTRADLRRYRVILLLGGRAPERWSDALGTGDVALLTEWVPQGGVLVFGYAGDGEGSADRWVMNRWLGGTGTGIVIGDAVLQDTARVTGGIVAPQPPARIPPGTLGLGVGTEFPAGRNHPLRVRYGAQAIARTTATAFVRRGDTAIARGGAAVVAAVRVGHGLVLVASRHLLGAIGPELRASTLPPLAQDSLVATRRFLDALARWTRRPAGWAAVPPAERATPITLPWPPRHLALRAPPLAAPSGAESIRLPAAAATGDTSAAADIPPWIARRGMHIGWSRATLAWPPSLDSLLGFSDAAGLNVLASPLGALALPDTSPSRGPTRTQAWHDAVARVGATSLRWFPLLSLAPPTGSRDAPCPLDEDLWTGTLLPALRIVGELGRGRPEPIAGVVLELTAPVDTPPPELCDSSIRTGLSRLGRDSAWIAALLTQSSSQRFDALLNSGLLGPYVAALEAEVAVRAAAVARAARRASPGLMFALLSAAPLADWLAFGLARGLGADSTRALVLLWDAEPLPAPVIAAHRSRGVSALHAVELATTGLTPRAWSRLRTPIYGASDGFWIGPLEIILRRPRTAAGPLSTDSLAQLVRRISRD